MTQEAGPGDLMLVSPTASGDITFVPPTVDSLLCVFYFKHYSYKHTSYLGVLDMCFSLSLYLHVLILSVGFMYPYV